MAKKASTSEQKVREIKRKSRKQYSGEEKIRIVLDSLRAEESVSELCWREAITESVNAGKEIPNHARIKFPSTGRPAFCF